MPSYSSSGKAAKSKPSKDLLELGKHLVEELGQADRGTTLGRWMAHHLARLMREAEEAGTARQRAMARKAAEKLIIELWAQRASLPGNADPMARYERALAIIDRLSPDGFPSGRHSANAMHGAAAELNEAVSKLLYSVILGEMKHDVPLGEFEDFALPFLDHVEQKVLHGFANIRIKIVSPTEDGAESPPISIEERIAAVRRTALEHASRALGKLKARLDNPVSEGEQFEDNGNS
jgi:hypothetical protein